MKKDVKELKEVYLNIWFRGLIYAVLGIFSMYNLVSDTYGMINGENVLIWMVLLNVGGVLAFSHSCVELQVQRHVIFNKIKDNL